MIQGFSSGLLGNRELIYETDLPSFQRDFASLKTLDHGYGPSINFTRASNATYFDVDGVLQTAGNNEPRFDHDPADGGKSLGLLIEEARTNSIRNSQAGGGAVGTPGTGMTNWNISSSANGLTRTLATGSVSGFSYIDVSFAGTATSAFTLFFDPEQQTQIVASSTQAWTHSVYLALVAGSVPDCLVGVREGLADGTLTAASTTNHGASLTASLQRVSHTRTLSEATTARVTPIIRMTIANGATISFTLRIAAPQLEQGAFPTSYIPTTTAAATRSADSAVVTPISSFYNQSEGTLFAQFVPTTLTSIGGFSRTALSFEADGGPYNGIGVGTAVNQNADSVLYAGVTLSLQWGISGGSSVVGANMRLAGAYAANDAQAAINGTLGTADTSLTLPTITRMRIGQRGASGGFLQGHIRKIAYWPKRLSNTLLEQLTT